MVISARWFHLRFLFAPPSPCPILPWPPMTLKTRFNLLLIILCLVLATGLIRLWVYERREARLIFEEFGGQRSQVLDRLIEMDGLSLRQFAHDYSLWSETADFLSQPEPDRNWAATNIDQSLATFGADIVWIFRTDGRLFYAVTAQGHNGAQPPHLPAFTGLFDELHRKKFIHFFFAGPEGIFEVRGAAVVESEDIKREQPPHGYLLVGRRWGASHLARFAEVTQGRINLTREIHIHQDSSDHQTQGIHLHRKLPDIHGRPVALLQVDYDIGNLSRLNDLNAYESIIFFFYGTSAILLVVFFTRRWVLRPLDRIGESLTTGNSGPLSPLLGQKSELGRVAKLIHRSFRDREELRETLEERARLGRDLHDGVIQSLYASGMNLASARALLEQDPRAANELLEQTRRELNVTIREVRSFITRLEPITTGGQSFSEAVRNLADFMQAIQPARCELAIDDRLAGSLSIDDRTQLLYIVREALSNALRHGAATAITIRLQSQAQVAELTVQDNGCGFDSTAPAGGGRGLANLAQRAIELSGSLDIRSQPGHGTTLTLRFPFCP
jgi:signal transduction histidine kinase